MSQNFTSLAVITLAISFASNTYATIMTVEIEGYVNGKPAAFLNSTSVKVGDKFGFTFEYDDTQQTSQLVSVNGGVIYTLITQLFTPAITAWWGTLPMEIAQYNLPAADGSILGWGTR